MMTYNELASAAWNGIEDLSQDPKSTDEHRSLQAAGRQALVIAPRDLSPLTVEQVTPPPSSRVMDLKKGGSMGAERMRLLRMRLWELRRMGMLKSVAITSALPKDGKSTVTLNLASIMSDGGQQRVLLIEGDLHCPSIGNSLGIGGNPGLAECMETGADPFSHIRRIEPLGWYLLQAGKTDMHPTDLVQSEAFPQLLSYVSHHFDWILIDTPPIFPVADTISICHAADGVLLVVRSGVTPRENVDEAVEMIGSSRIAGIVLNGAEDINKSYYKYSSYYGPKK